MNRLTDYYGILIIPINTPLLNIYTFEYITTIMWRNCFVNQNDNKIENVAYYWYNNSIIN